MRRLVLLALLMALVVAACGGGAAQPAGSTKIAASDFKYDPRSPSVKAGKVVLFIQNSGPAAHDMVIADGGGKIVARSELVQSGDTSVFTISNLPAGSYQFYCDVPGHKDAGMVGTLTVS